jgi:hypothetical protein
MPKFTGTVKEVKWAAGSKSEHMAIVLDTGDGHAPKISLRGGNPFRDKELEQFIGQKVSFEGIIDPAYAAPIVFVTKASDISVIASTKTPPRGPRP